MKLIIQLIIRECLQYQVTKAGNSEEPLQSRVSPLVIHYQPQHVLRSSFPGCCFLPIAYTETCQGPTALLKDPSSRLAPTPAAWLALFWSLSQRASRLPYIRFSVVALMVLLSIVASRNAFCRPSKRNSYSAAEFTSL